MGIAEPWGDGGCSRMLLGVLGHILGMFPILHDEVRHPPFDGGKDLQVFVVNLYTVYNILTRYTTRHICALDW